MCVSVFLPSWQGIKHASLCRRQNRLRHDRAHTCLAFSVWGFLGVWTYSRIHRVGNNGSGIREWKQATLSTSINNLFKSPVVSVARLLEDKEVSSKLNVSNLLTGCKEGSGGT